ncbi:MAG: von Willebrand factor type A domain-containing protein [Pontiellaceae bacterium]|nr:von Willebrand factor type A domain-containing protein [Pontiellaceae bacterium]
MRSCKRFEKMLPGYLHGELYEKDYHALRAHLKQCAACRDELEAQQMALQLAGRSLATAPVPVRLTARRSLQTKNVEVRQSLAQKILHSLQFKVALAAGAAVMLFIAFSSTFVVFSKIAGPAPEFCAPEPIDADLRIEAYSPSRSSSESKFNKVVDTVVLKADQAIDKGIELYERGQYADAKNSFEEVLAENPYNTEAMDYLSRTYAQVKDRAKRDLARGQQIGDIEDKWGLDDSALLAPSVAVAKQNSESSVNHWDFEGNSAEVVPPPAERPRMALKKPEVTATSRPKPSSRIVAKVKMAPSVPEISIPDLTGSGDALLSNADAPDDFSGELTYNFIDAGLSTVNGQAVFYADAGPPSPRNARSPGGIYIDGKSEIGNSADIAMDGYLASADLSSGLKKESSAGGVYFKDGPEGYLHVEESEGLFGYLGPSFDEGNALAVGEDISLEAGAFILGGYDYRDSEENPEEWDEAIADGAIVSRNIVGYGYKRVDAEEEELSAIFDALPEVAQPDMPVDDIFAIPPVVREPAEYNPYVMAAENAFSTFSIDVDTASYGLARNQIFSGVLPEPESVRTEEFVNSFDYDYRPPAGAQTFAVYNEMAPSPFRSRMQILKVGVKGRRIGRDDHRGAVLTLVVDTSGSMSSPERIGLVKQSLGLLLDQLDPSDKVAIVQFGGEARLVREHTPASEKEALLAAIDALQPGGPTQFDKGLELGYQVAVNAFQAGDSNRIIIMSDGVANLGELKPDAILNQVEAYRKKGIYLSVLGFGAGTYDDNLLERLANRGDGAYAYVDTIDEARHLFVDQLAATLHVIASDVKIQVEFNPKRVVRYRQIGYENRQLTQEQFRDDSVDAGEVGSGQSVTALYEVELAPEASPRDPIATVYVRYRRTDNQAVEEINSLVTDNSRVDRFDEASPRFQLAACVAEYAERLRCSPYADGTEMIQIIERLQPVAAALDLDGQVQELLQLISMTRID